MAGLGDAGDSNAHRLRLSGNTQAEGKLVKLRPGVVPVIAVNVGAGLLERDGDGLQSGDQTGGDAVHTVKPAIAVLGIRKHIIPALAPHCQGLLPPLVLQPHGLGRQSRQQAVNVHWQYRGSFQHRVL